MTTAEMPVAASPPTRIPGDGATRALADWVAALRFAEIPASVRDHAKLCLLDTLGCGLYGAQQEWGRMSAAAAAEMAPGGAATLWGHNDTAGPAAAALANGTAAHGFELDDIHVRSMFHAGAVVIPAALAVAEARHASGEALLAGIIAGYEVGIRLGIAAGPAPGLRGFHMTGVLGSVAAAVAAAKILALQPEACANAIGIGATQAAGLYCARTGAMTKRFHAGHAAQSGVIAGFLAERGFTGSTDVIEVPFGGFMSTLSGEADFEELTADLGRRWELQTVGFKAYAACASAHTIIDNLDKLMRQGLTADNLVRLRIRMSRIAVKNVGWPYRPAGIVAAQMNGFYAAAVKLLDGDAFVEQYRENRLADPRILALIEKTTIEHDPELDVGGTAKRHASRAVAELADGRLLDAYTEQRRGSSHHPLTSGEIVDKFRKTSAASVSAARADDLRRLVLSVEQQPDLAPISRLLRGDHRSA